MNIPARLAAYIAILAVTLLGAYGIGSEVGPIGGSDPSDTHQEVDSQHH